MYIILFILSLIGFLAAAVVHGLTFVGITVPGAFVLHTAAIALFFPAVFSMNAVQKKHPDKKGVALLPMLLGRAPGWMKALLPVIFIYTLVNFMLFMSLSGGGGPHKENGKYYIMNHGTIVKELTAEEYHWHQAYEVRGFSGHWLLFLYLPTVIFLAKSKEDPE